MTASNFAFLQAEWPEFFAEAVRAERVAEKDLLPKTAAAAAAQIQAALHKLAQDLAERDAAVAAAQQKAAALDEELIRLRAEVATAKAVNNAQPDAHDHNDAQTRVWPAAADLLRQRYEHWFWDDSQYPPRAVQGFHKKDELHLLVQRRSSRKSLAQAPIDSAIVARFVHPVTRRPGRQAATEALAAFLTDKTMGGNQIEFMNLAVNYLTEHGSSSPARCTAPFTAYAPQGPKNCSRPRRLASFSGCWTT